MSDRDLDRFYREAGAEDAERPSAAVRQSILREAQRLAAGASQDTARASDGRPTLQRRRRLSPWISSWISSWASRGRTLRWQIVAPVAAALLAALVLAPEWSTHLFGAAGPSESTRQSHQNASETAADLARSAPAASPEMAAPSANEAAAHAASPSAPPAPFSHSDLAVSNMQAPAAPMPVPPPVLLSRTPPSPLPPSAAAGDAVGAAAARAAAASAPSSRAEATQSADAQSAANVAAGGTRPPENPLQQAASSGDETQLQALLQASGVGIDARDAHGRTALMLAVMHAHASIVRELLERGADPNIADARGRRPLAVAQEQNQREIVAALLADGAR